MNPAVAFWFAKEEYAACTFTPQKLKKYVALSKKEEKNSWSAQM